MTSYNASGRRDDAGFLPLNGYGAIGEGRSIALAGEDGSIDWWCVPNMDSPPLFDRLLIGTAELPDGTRGGYFAITPKQPFHATQGYRANSNVHEIRSTTDTGEAVLTESLNSGTAGRLPWAELARRIEVIRGPMEFSVELRFGHRAGARNPYAMHPGTDRLDASLALAVRFAFDGRERLASTLEAIDRSLGIGGLHYRYSGMDQEEGCFLACSFWMVEARALLGQTASARTSFAQLREICGISILPEMIAPRDYSWLGNLPQGLSHLAALQAAVALKPK